MPPESSSFTALNLPANSERPQWMGSFALQAPPNTDLWRKPPSRDTSTAPILYTALRQPFVAAEVTVSADWELEWDQGGLVIFAGAPPGRPTPARTNSAPTTTTPLSTTTTPASTTTHASPPANQSPSPRAPPYTPQAQHQPRPAPPSYYAPSPPASKWLKAGLEFYNGTPHASSVCATSDGADWSLAPLSSSSPPSSSSITYPYSHPLSHPHHHYPTELRVKLERVGYALWVWFEDPGTSTSSTSTTGTTTHPSDPGATGGGWKKLREVTWFFWGVEDKAVRVGVYASRPANFGGFGAAGGGGGDAGFGGAARDLGVGGSGGGGAGTGTRGLVVEFEGLEIF
ncbi:MAG: hypothetical protein M1833_002983 [Piccolia ochrophora]|nr:MAG: hypothetical protein M1833_002983 [Piccolia ochrophora]